MTIRSVLGDILVAILVGIAAVVVGAFVAKAVA